MSLTGSIDDGNDTFNESARKALTSVPHVLLGVTRESTSGLLPSLLPWTNGQCPHAARRKLTDHAVLVSF